MADFSNLIIKLSGDASGVDRAFRQSQRLLEGFATTASQIGARMTAAVTVPLVGIGTAALQAAGRMEQTTVAFKTMLGSADAAQKHLKDLKDFAASTPFEFEDVAKASRKMQALGFSAREILPTLRTIGNAAAGLGLGAEGIDRITLALGQMRAKGMVQAEEMRQLAEVGIPAWQILAKTLNTDVAGAMKAVEKRTVEAAVAVPAILAGMNAKFGGLMEEQSKTLLGQWSNFKDRMTFTLIEIGNVLAPTAKEMLKQMEGLGAAALKAAQAFESMPGPLKSISTAMAGIMVVAGPLLIVLGQMAGAVTNIRALAASLSGLRNLAGASIGGGLLGALGIGSFAGSMISDQIAKLKSYQDATRAMGEQQKKTAQDVARLTGSVQDSRAVLVTSALAVTQKANADNAGAVAAKKQADATKEQTHQWQLLGGTLADVAGEIFNIYREFSGFQSKAIEAGPAIDLVAISARGLERAGAQAAASMQVLGLSADYAVRQLAAGVEPSAQLLAVMDAMSPKIITAEDAFKTLNMTASSVLDSIAKKMEEAYQALVQLYYLGKVSARDINEAADRVRQARQRAGSGGTNNQQNATQQIGRMRQPLIQVSTVVTDLSRGLSDVIFKAKSMSEAFADASRQILQSITRNIIERGINSAITALGNFMSRLTGVGGTIGRILGGGGTGGFAGGPGAGGIIGGGGGGGVGGVVGGGGGAVGSIIGGVASSAIGMVTGAISAVSGIIGNFQMAGMSRDMGRMEETLRGLLNVVALNGSESIHHFAKQSMFANVGLRDYWQGTGHTLLVKMSSALDVLVARGGGNVSGGGNGQIAITIQGGVFASDSSSIDQFADFLARRIRERGGLR